MNKITLTAAIERTPRVMQVEGMFDIDAEAKSITEIPLQMPDLSARKWNVGLIVGPSGAGKTTIAKHLFNTQIQASENLTWDTDRSIIDAFPRDMSIQEVTTLLSSVGFSSPPSWLRPFHALSNGEQFRVSMARLMAEERDLAVVDEFTSVIDRTVAQIGSHAIAKTIRKRDQQFVAVTCHYDVEDWLQPDWTYEPASGIFTWRSVQPRPGVELEIIRGNQQAWQLFSRHHYLNKNLATSAAIFVGLINGEPACLVAMQPHPHAKIKNLVRGSRVVVMPDFQGINIANVMLNKVCGAYVAMGKKVTAVSSHPALMHMLPKSGTWTMIRKPSRVARYGSNSSMKRAVATSARSRLTASFQFTGPADETLFPLIF